MTLRLCLCLLCLSGLGAFGCADDDAHLQVRGSALVVLDGTASGFDFPSDRRLEDDRVGRYDRVAGHCTIGRGAEGEPDIVSLSLSLPESAIGDGEGARSFAVRVQGEAAKVTAMMGDVEFSADAGVECDIEDYRDVGAGLAGAQVDCVIRDATGRTATATADLHFGGCEIVGR